MYGEPQKATALYLKGLDSYFDLQRSWINYYTLFYHGWEEALSKFSAKMAELKGTNPETGNLTFEKFLTIYLATLKEYFDLLLKSDLFVETQAKMLHSFMDTLKYQRDFWENLLTANPALPFVYRTEIDTFYQRMHELRRKINVLEKRTRNISPDVI
jgi:hypothetical protein